MANVEPKLQNRLDSPEAPTEIIDVVLRFSLPQNEPMASENSIRQRSERAEKVSEAINNALKNAESETGQAPVDVTPHPHIGTAYVQATPVYLRALLKQETVIGATYNENK